MHVTLNMSHMTSNFKLSLPFTNIFPSIATKFTLQTLCSGQGPHLGLDKHWVDLTYCHTPTGCYTLYTAYQVLYTVFRCLLTAHQHLFSRDGYAMPLMALSNCTSAHQLPQWVPLPIGGCELPQMSCSPCFDRCSPCFDHCSPCFDPCSHLWVSNIVISNNTCNGK